MDYVTFLQRFTQSLPPGTVMRNPGGGTTEILYYTEDDRLVYRRGASRIYVSIEDLYTAYREFLGQTVDSTDLRRFAPAVFDSKHNGHSCNCTVLFLALQAMGLVDRIEGAGRAGYPFRVRL